MDYLARYSLEYWASSQSYDQQRKHETIERTFKALRDEDAPNTARKLGAGIVKETTERYGECNAQIKLERLLQVREIPIR